jgi:hypothetical protein
MTAVEAYRARSAWREAMGAGKAYVYSAKDGNIPSDAFGFDAVTLGNIDGDGSDDFLISSGVRPAK